jgi:hypothetical protein
MCLKARRSKINEHMANPLIGLRLSDVWAIYAQSGNVRPLTRILGDTGDTAVMLDSFFGKA